MKHLIALITYALITMLAGVTNSNWNNLKHFHGFFTPTSIKKIVETDTIKPVITNRGNPYITNYDLEINNQQIWSICQDNSDQMIFAHRRGLTIFNGSSIEEIILPAIPISLETLPEHNLILIGCDNQFGYIKFVPPI